MINWGPYSKTIAAVVAAAVAFATLVITSDPSAITGPEYLSGVIGLAGAIGVYTVSNKS